MAAITDATKKADMIKAFIAMTEELMGTSIVKCAADDTCAANAKGKA